MRDPGWINGEDVYGAGKSSSISRNGGKGRNVNDGRKGRKGREQPSEARTESVLATSAPYSQNFKRTPRHGYQNISITFHATCVFPYRIQRSQSCKGQLSPVNSCNEADLAWSSVLALAQTATKTGVRSLGYKRTSLQFPIETCNWVTSYQ